MSIWGEFSKVRNWPFLSKSLGYSPWFLKWRILVRAGNRAKLSETPPLCSQMRLYLLSRLFVSIWGEFSKVRNWPFLSKSLGYSPWFLKWRILVRAGNRAKLSETPPLCSQMRLYLLSRLFVSIWGEFSKVRNWPFLSKKPGL